MRLETERLILRPVRPGDREAIARLWSSPRVTRFVGGMRDRKGVRRALKDYHDPEAIWDLWAVEEQETGRVVGHCGLLPRKLEGEDLIEIIYIFGSRSWGRGFATEAASALVDYAWDRGCEALFAFIEPANVGSQHVAEKLGFAHQRTIPLPDGRREQVWVLSRPRRRRRTRT